MADDRPGDQRDERIAEWLEPEPLDELTRRRLVATAMSARDPESATTPAPPASTPSHAWRWIATAAVIVVLLVGALALFTAQGGNQESAFDDRRSKLEDRGGQAPPASPSPSATAAPPRDAGDFGDLDAPGNLRQLRTALEQPQGGAVAPTNGADTAAESRASQLSTLACRDQLPAGTITAVASGTLDGRRALVVLTERADGSQSIDAVLTGPCEVRPLS